ncbi:hypothetical protein HETIRDRAFT_232841, partial [Heterobasidion irregulare TC 32-1]
LSQIYKKTLSFFKKHPCLWQLKVVKAILKGDRDVTCISGTGSGKTLTFWMPLLFASRIQIIVTPLNILGKQNEGDLRKLGIPAVTLTGQTSNPAIYQYCAIIVSSEELIKENGGFEKLWKNEQFTSQII